MYFSKDNPNANMKNSCNLVKAYIFNKNHIKGVGISYVRHSKTKADIQKEISAIESQSYISEKDEVRLNELKMQLEMKKQIQKPKIRRSKVKTDNLQWLNRSRRKLLLYLYGNFDVPFALMITLTYGVKVHSFQKATKNFTSFSKKFRRKFPNAVWIVVFDLHNDNSIHLHFIVKNARGATNEVLTKMWRTRYGICN